MTDYLQCFREGGEGGGIRTFGNIRSGLIAGLVSLCFYDDNQLY